MVLIINKILNYILILILNFYLLLLLFDEMKLLYVLFCLINIYNLNKEIFDFLYKAIIIIFNIIIIRIRIFLIE